MKSLIKYGLAAAMVFATAMPAMAKSWVVCLDRQGRPVLHRGDGPRPPPLQGRPFSLLGGSDLWWRHRCFERDRLHASGG